MIRPSALCAGSLLVALYTLVIAAADGITKRIAGAYEAPQLFALSAAIVVALCWLGAQATQRGTASLATSCRGAMAARAALTVVAAAGFFMAFRLLPFADVFLFIALMPVIAALLSGPVLGERVRPAAWTALALGSAGVLCLLPAGPGTASAGHFWAALGAVSGTGSMVASRWIGRRERASLAQVFWPNLAILAVMGAALPWVWRPMPGADWGWVAAYAVLLFAARWLVVEALRLLPAWLATPLMNLQFVWMVAIGALAFGEWPDAGTWTGVALVIASGLWLVAGERRRPVQRPVASAG
ncbi:DMT family transporter [Roseivivax sp. CAU 1761]